MNNSNDESIKYPQFNDNEKSQKSDHPNSPLQFENSIIYPKLKEDPAMDNRLAIIEGALVIDDGYVPKVIN